MIRALTREHYPLVTDTSGPDRDRIRHCVASFDRRFAAAEGGSRQDLLELLQVSAGMHDAIVKGLGNSRLSDEYALLLPGALMRICRRFGVPPGLLRPAPRARGKWATSWLGDLANPLGAVANAIAYEVLASERLLSTSVLGFRPGEGDAISFGFKLQASYPGSLSQLPNQPVRETIESDLQIYVPAEFSEIGVDFKHSFGTRPIQLSVVQLSGVCTALATGEVDRFLFVTNHKFSRASHLAIRTANESLIGQEAAISATIEVERTPIALVEGLAPLAGADGD